MKVSLLTPVYLPMNYFSALSIWGQFFHESSHTNESSGGVFCNSAIKAAENDAELLVQSMVQMRKELREQVSRDKVNHSSSWSQ